MQANISASVRAADVIRLLCEGGRISEGRVDPRTIPVKSEVFVESVCMRVHASGGAYENANTRYTLMHY